MRPGVFVAVTLWLTPVMAVGVHAFGIPDLLAVVTGLGLAAAVGWAASRPLASALEPAEVTARNYASRTIAFEAGQAGVAPIDIALIPKGGFTSTC